MNAKDIARKAGVSVGTVSNVVNGKSSVGEKVRIRVLEAMAEVSWQPNELARGLRKPSANLVVMFVPDISNPFFPAVVNGAEEVLSKAGYRLVLCNTANDTEREVSVLSELRGFHAAGYLVIPATRSKLAPLLRSMNKPIVYLDRTPSEWKGDAVTGDNEGGAFLATRYLLDQGHRRIAIITGPADSPNAAARLTGFRRALKEASCHFKPEYLVEGSFDRVSGFELTKQILELKPRPTAVFASNDMIATGCLMALRERGLVCPQDLSLIGFDNLDFAELMDPALTTIHQPGDQIGIQGANLLVTRLSGDKGKRIQRVILPTELRIRASVRHVKYVPRSKNPRS